MTRRNVRPGWLGMLWLRLLARLGVGNAARRLGGMRAADTRKARENAIQPQLPGLETAVDKGPSGGPIRQFVKAAVDHARAIDAASKSI